MSLEVKITCPLGAKCEEAKDGALHRCAWYAHVRGYDRNTGQELDEWRCAMNWMPTLLIENSGMQKATGEAICDFRDNMVKANEVSQQVLLAAVQTKLIEG